MLGPELDALPSAFSCVRHSSIVFWAGRAISTRRQPPSRNRRFWIAGDGLPTVCVTLEALQPRPRPSCTIARPGRRARKTWSSCGLRY